MVHEMFLMVTDGKLHRADIDLSAARILDLGTGTGLWCVDMGDQYPSAEIVGVDMTPTMKSHVPDNVSFEIDDIEQPWTYDKPFDYIHSRYMCGSIKDWPGLVKQCFE